MSYSCSKGAFGGGLTPGSLILSAEELSPFPSYSYFWSLPSSASLKSLSFTGIFFFSGVLGAGFSVSSRFTMINSVCAASCFSPSFRTIFDAAQELGGAEGYPGSQAFHFLAD